MNVWKLLEISFTENCFFFRLLLTVKMKINHKIVSYLCYVLEGIKHLNAIHA